MKPNTVEWLDFAKADLLGARVLAETQKLENLVAYHCHQSAEKALKAVLVELSVDFPKTHDLGLLADLIRNNGVSVAEILPLLKEINPYSIAPRYPGFETESSELPLLMDSAQSIFDYSLGVIEQRGTSTDEKNA
ncbi:COG2250 Uncharacterized conserved protein related to C-terminal domain of eukaryotic chaperone, SACSIN [Fimbriimonadaceae bacterium]